MKNRKEKLDINTILMRTVALLLMLVLVSTSMVTGRYARYVSTATGQDSARVAKFHVAESGSLVENQSQYFSEDVYPGASFTREVLVVNNSEVTIEYTITAENPEDNLPLAFSVGESVSTVTGGKVDIYTQPTDGIMEPGETKNFVLTIQWPADISENKDDSYSGMVDLIRITLNATQID